MRVNIWCMRDFARGVEAVDLGWFDLPLLPREGDYLCIHDGWAMSTVKLSCFNVYSGTGEVEIEPDYTGEYRAALSEPAQ